jgi:hypothetical protein
MFTSNTSKENKLLWKDSNSISVKEFLLFDFTSNLSENLIHVKTIIKNDGTLNSTNDSIRMFREFNSSTRSEMRYANILAIDIKFFVGAP